MLENKVALVTGASRGIGRAIALALGKEHATVLVNYSGSKDKALEVMEQITAFGGKAEAICCDISDYSSCEAMCKTIIEKYNRVDILVNNAGITKDNLLMKMSETDYDQVLAVNLKGTFNTMRHLSKYFLKQRAGKIINISSVSGILGNPGQANYAASKAGVIGLTKSCARELASRGICVNAVAPGFIETDMTDKMTESVKESIQESIPLKRVGKPEDIANTVLFLASDKADYITGQVISVDGGMAI